MQISLDSAGGNSIQSYSADGIVIEGRLISHSVIVTATVVEAWPPAAVAALTSEHVLQLLAHEPAIIILGTGDRLVFPPAAVLAPVYRRGTGIEVMANDAAIRTYDVLLSEQRSVLLALLQD